jgi:hypothetical protein
VAPLQEPSGHFEREVQNSFALLGVPSNSFASLGVPSFAGPQTSREQARVRLDALNSFAPSALGVPSNSFAPSALGVPSFAEMKTQGKVADYKIENEFLPLP